MAIDFFEYLLNPNWKNLSKSMKQVMFQNILRYFVNPMSTIGEVKPVFFEYAGVKTETFEVEIDQRMFVFVPGQKKCILGWDGGLTGLNGLDCSEERQELRYALKRYLIQHVTGFLFTKQEPEIRDFSAEQLSTQLVEQAINQMTSPLREVDIPALLVEKQPSLVGMKYLGQYSVVSGQMLQQESVSEEVLETIQQLVIPDTIQEVFYQDFPRAIRTDQLFIQQNHENPDEFACYMEDPISYQELKREIERTGMGLLNEDEWEYCCGNASRRLFKWGNQLHRSLLQDEDTSPLWKPNMFGLMIANAEYGPELIEQMPYAKGGWLAEQHKAPVLNLLPLSTYYRLSSLSSEVLDQVLPAGYYCVRRTIRLDI